MLHNHKFIDIGSAPIGIESVSSSEGKKYYPSITLDAKAFPQIKDVSVGDSIELAFRANVTSLTIDEDRQEARLELKKAVLLESGVEEEKEKLEEKKSKNKTDESLDSLVSKKGKYE